jgi:predicted nucleotidyltransferase
MRETEAMTLEEVRQRRDEIERLASRRGARALRVFGSVARGEARPDSDLDLLVSFEPQRTLLDLAGLELDLEDLLQCDVDVVEEGGLSPYMEDRILAEAVPL